MVHQPSIFFAVSWQSNNQMEHRIIA